MKVHGADGSHWQEDLDLALAQSKGLQWFYHKVSEGTSVTDPEYKIRRRAAEKIGLPFGGYHYASPDGGDAVAEARYYVNLADPRPGDLVPVLDYEEKFKNPERWCRNFMGEVIRLLKEEGMECRPMHYGPDDFGKDYDFLRWVPRYNNTNTPPRIPWDIWQFSDGKLGIPNFFPGLDHIDLNYMRPGLKIIQFTIPAKQEKPLPKKRKSIGPFNFVSQNIQAIPMMPQRDVVHDIQLTASQAGIIGFQEIGTRRDQERYDDAVQALEATGEWETYWGQGTAYKRPDIGDDQEKPGYSTPIAWKRKYWQFMEGDSWRIHQGVPRVTGHRYVTWAVLKHRGTGALVIVFNTHFVAGSFNQKRERSEAVRKPMWRAGWAKLKTEWLPEMIEKYPEAAIVGMADFNAMFTRDREEFMRPNGKMIVPGTRRTINITHPGAIDHLLYINGSKYKWSVVSTDTLKGRKSDHQGRLLRAAISWD